MKYVIFHSVTKQWVRLCGGWTNRLASAEDFKTEDDAKAYMVEKQYSEDTRVQSFDLALRQLPNPEILDFLGPIHDDTEFIQGVDRLVRDLHILVNTYRNGPE